MKTPKPPSTPQAERESKLAKALRENLKRRKSAAAGKPKTKDGD